MQDYLNGGQSNARYYNEPYEFQVLDNPATPLAQNINHNISNMIEDVKRQRLDIIKLNNELKSSRSVIDRRNLEEVKNRQELSQLVRQLKREKEQLQQEMRHLREINDVNEQKLSDKESLLSDFRMKNADLVRQLGDKHKELEDLRFTSNKLQIRLEENHRENRTSFKQREELTNMEIKANKYFDKYKAEGQKVIRLQKDLTGVRESYNNLLEDNQKVNTKLKQYLELNADLKKENNAIKGDNSASRTAEELKIDLRVFSELYGSLDMMMQEVQREDFDEEEGEPYDDEN